MIKYSNYFYFYFYYNDFVLYSYNLSYFVVLEKWNKIEITHMFNTYKN